jgi:hypothetical protein
MRKLASIALSNRRLINYVGKILNGNTHTHVVNTHSTFAVAGTAVEAEVAVA